MGIMLVYDITNEKSFDNIKNWIRNIEEHASADVEKMILGNKCDMNDRRQVSKVRIKYLFLVLIVSNTGVKRKRRTASDRIRDKVHGDLGQGQHQC